MLPAEGCRTPTACCLSVVLPRSGLPVRVPLRPRLHCFVCVPAAVAKALPQLPTARRYGRQSWLREGGKLPRVDAENIEEALNKSLQRLGTDYVDLLQVGCCCKLA